MIVESKKVIAHYDQAGALALVKRFGRSLIRSICDYQIQEFRGRIIADQDPPFLPRENESAAVFDCALVQAGDSLEKYAEEFSLPFRDSLVTLKKRLASGCILILARRALQDDDGYEIAGYSIMELGAFSAAGVRSKISPDIMFVHYTEVTRNYRGQRIAERISRARNDYCRAKGIRMSCTAHSPSNVISERAFRKFGSSLLCYIVRLSFFRGLFVWHTPRKTIERALGQLAGRKHSRLPYQRTRRPE